MKKIQNQTFAKERSLYNIKDTFLSNVTFSGEEDGESPLKECENIKLSNCKVDLRYAFWHDRTLSINESILSESCRAPIWYSNDVNIKNSKILGVKTFRESGDISLSDSELVSSECFWKCNNIFIKKTNIESEYAFLETCNINISKVTFKGKYSFQYVNNVEIKDSTLDTKDAFWHARNVVVKDSIIKGEYLGWYSENLTFINCEIISHQPLCYCKSLKLINCKMNDCDLAFEYSEVEASIKGKINSIKNPLKGKIVADDIGEIVKEDSKYPCDANIITKGKSK